MYLMACTSRGRIGCTETSLFLKALSKLHVVVEVVVVEPAEIFF